MSAAPASTADRGAVGDPRPQRHQPHPEDEQRDGQRQREPGDRLRHLGVLGDHVDLHFDARRDGAGRGEDHVVQVSEREPRAYRR